MGPQRFEEIITIEERVKYLKIGKSTLDKMAREGEIPTVRIANQWRFRKENIDMKTLATPPLTPPK